MPKSPRTFSKIIPKLLLIAFFAFFLTTPALAQNNFNPPSVLPGDNYNIGGYGDACIGLANMIRQGTITLRQIPCFIKYFSQTLIAIAGSLSVIFVMVGGYRYTLEATDDSRAEAKRTITYALVGLMVSLMAWILVDIVLQLATE